MKKRVLSAMPSQTFAEGALDAAQQTGKLNYDGYKKVWSDEFNGDSLNRADWNVEIHEKGWVNNELQEYVDSAENIQVKDGKLIINPVKKVTDGDTSSTKEAASYTSGRVSTQNKQTFTYGRFECRAKVPKGQGYLPAFWLMANDENVYGQWPRCGEIDCMEVMGQETNKAYGTLHYGNPHSQSQGTYTITDGADFSDDFHIYTCDWEPGKITWYVDGVKYHEESEWHSTTVGQGTLAYPAPFDQPFYIILNLAVGGSWVGNPNDETSFENNPYVIDYVRVYQKDSYDEDVKRPGKISLVMS
jgi:Beta-glucanase/Beta-glucan synthetase